MSEKFSDILIIGTDLAGLIAGAFLAKRGLAVTVINFDRDVALEKKNIQPNLITHLESRLFKSILGRLSILDHELNIIRKLEVPYQVVMPKHRIDIYRDREKLYRELKREFPGDYESLKAFYEGIDHFEVTLDSEALQDLILPKGLLKRWKFYQFVKKNGLNQRIAEYTEELRADSEVQTFFESQLKLLSTTHAENPFTYPIAKSLGNDNCLLFEIKGGIGHLKKLFLDKIEDYGGQIKNEAPLETIAFEGLRAKALKLGGFEGMISFRYLFWNHEVRLLADYLPKKFWTKPLIKKIQHIRPSHYHFSIQYEVDANVIPMGMKENLVLIQDPNQELSSSNYLHLNIYHPNDDNSENKAYLNVSYLLPAKAIDEAASFFVELHEKITEQIAALMPFSQGRFQLKFPLPHQVAVQEGMLFSLEKSDFEIFRENAMANPIYEIIPKKFADLFPISNRTIFKNLFITSPELLASLGFEGKFLLGLKTIDLIWKEIETKQKKPALKKS